MTWKKVSQQAIFDANSSSWSVSEAKREYLLVREWLLNLEYHDVKVFKTRVEAEVALRMGDFTKQARVIQVKKERRTKYETTS